MAYVQRESPLLRVRKTTKGKGRNFRTASEGAGMTAAGVKKYRKQNPGSKLKTAVTKCDVKPGTKPSPSGKKDKNGKIKRVNNCIKIKKK